MNGVFEILIIFATLFKNAEKRINMDKRSYLSKVSFENPNKSWLLVDAENQTLGRLASKVAYLLRGKHKPSFTPHLDMGDNIVVINARKVRLTGKKMNKKVYVRYTGYPGGQRFANPENLLQSKPEYVIERAVKRMLPQTKLGGQIIRNLHVFADAQHTLEAQQPKPVDLNTIIAKSSK